MTNINEKYLELKRKYRHSVNVFTLINLLIFFVTASIVILNIFAIRFNPSKDTSVKWIFVSVAILVSVSGFISGIISLYVFRKRNKEIGEKIDKIESEKESYNNKTGDYSSTNPDEKLIENVTKILNA